ncbi:MAG: tetratricopeptide repeat protein, partial [Acidobacteriota bacterium]
TVGGSIPTRSWIWLTAVAVVIALVLLVLRPWGDRADLAAKAEMAMSTAVPSVAVLPFHNLSADSESDYFSDGMTEEIISKLSRIDGLEVASRSSVAPYTDRARDVQQIGRDLGVRYLLDGSVRRAGDQVRVSAQLVDGQTGRNLWSEDFDGTLEDVFAVQERTALEIANRLDLELSPEEQRDVQRRSTENVAAYDAYLQGLALSRDWGVPEQLERAVEFFERALELDPDFAEALAGLSAVESDLYRTFDPSQERIERAEDLARRAAELDPAMAEASHALGAVAGNRFDYRRAAELFRESVRLAPKEPRFWDNLSWALAYMTPPDGQGAVDAALEAIKLQPHFPGAYYHLGRGLLAMGRNEEARVAFETMVEQDPDVGTSYLAMAQYYLAVGEYQQALASLEGDSARDTIINRYYTAAAQAAMGRSDEALATLDTILEMGFRDFDKLEASPYFESLRDNPGFKELIDLYRD